MRHVVVGYDLTQARTTSFYRDSIRAYSLWSRRRRDQREVTG